MRNVFVRGVAAGATAGLLTSVAAYAWLEPVLERAIALEGPSDGEGPVSRETQKLLGMPSGFLLVGVALGLLFAVTYRALPAHASPWRRSVRLAAAGFVALALVPQLRYPANPPGVGDPDTIAVRTGAYLLSVALGVVVVAGARAALRHLHARAVSEPVRHCAVVAGSVLVVGVAYALLPDGGGPVDAPADLVYDFRVRSLGLLALLYALLGACFGALSEWVQRESTRAEMVGSYR